jgi:hypothetical protein
VGRGALRRRGKEWHEVAGKQGGRAEPNEGRDRFLGFMSSAASMRDSPSGRALLVRLELAAQRCHATATHLGVVDAMACAHVLERCASSPRAPRCRANVATYSPPGLHYANCRRFTARNRRRAVSLRFVDASRNRRRAPSRKRRRDAAPLAQIRNAPLAQVRRRAPSRKRRRDAAPLAQVRNAPLAQIRNGHSRKFADALPRASADAPPRANSPTRRPTQVRQRAA